ncbi:hypothetical protein ACFQZ1_15475 [Bacillus sp. CGMCC 1.60114]|uniref:hypothetical protein n=1 Tax=unclassified Bacillus (in: firmicutes) TaxID=185979 RepID=UPI003642C688
MLKQTFKRIIPLYPEFLLPGWHVEHISQRQEGKGWETLWFQVIAPTGMFRVKQFFLDIMEPTFPDSCLYQGQGECFRYNTLTYWRGINYKGNDSYVTSKWKMQIEISIDDGVIEQHQMEEFLYGLQPFELEAAKQQIKLPFHRLSFQIHKEDGMGEINRCSIWSSPQEKDFVSLPLLVSHSWELESVGFGNHETQYIYWDTKEQLYALWACRHANYSYLPVSSWIRNYSSPKKIGNCEYYAHPQRGTVVYQDFGDEQIAYVFRGAPCTSFTNIQEIFSF